MHFRVRKNVIQLIRTIYDAPKKKGVSGIVGVVRLAEPRLDEGLRAQLTADEIAEFELWIATRHRVEMLRSELTVLSLADSMAEAEKWFEREGQSLAARSAATAIVFSWQSLRKRLAKSGLLD